MVVVVKNEMSRRRERVKRMNLEVGFAGNMETE